MPDLDLGLNPGPGLPLLLGHLSHVELLQGELHLLEQSRVRGGEELVEDLEDPAETIIRDNFQSTLILPNLLEFDLPLSAGLIVPPDQILDTSHGGDL